MTLTVSCPGSSMMVRSIKSAVGVGSLLMTSVTVPGAPGTLVTSLKTCGGLFGAGTQPAIEAAAHGAGAAATKVSHIFF